MRLVGVVQLQAAPHGRAIGDVLIDLADGVALEADALAGEIVFGGIASDRAVRDREERQIRPDLWRDRDARPRSARVAADSDADQAVPCVG